MVYYEHYYVQVKQTKQNKQQVKLHRYLRKYLCTYVGPNCTMILGINEDDWTDTVLCAFLVPAAFGQKNTR